MHRRILALSLAAATASASLAQDAPREAPLERRSWGPEQATGAPDTPEPGDRPTAWAPRERQAGRQTLTLEYAREVRPVAVLVYESDAPGALAELRLRSSEGWSRSWQGQLPAPDVEALHLGVVPLADAPPTTGLQLVLDTERVEGWNEIDAVGLLDCEGVVHWAVEAFASSSFAGDSLAPGAWRLDEARSTAPAPKWARSGLEQELEQWRLAVCSGSSAEELGRLSASFPATNGAAQPSFEGQWQTTFGEMWLEVAGTRVRGAYRLGGLSTLEGSLRPDGRFEFAYQEPSAAGEGWFELSEDGQQFAGQWRALPAEGEAEAASWSPWVGRRQALPVEEADPWLVVLEAPWGDAIDGADYSFGEMVEEVFARVQDLRVVRRTFYDAEDLRRLCGELAFVNAPIHLIVASHAGPEGLAVEGRVVPPAVVADALALVRHLRLVHFSACATMEGDFAPAIYAARGADAGLLGVSGYAESVGWLESALVEFLYFDLILARGLAPERAAATVLHELRFAGAGEEGASALGQARFQFVAPPELEF